jgi:hypothetical protein
MTLKEIVKICMLWLLHVLEAMGSFLVKILVWDCRHGSSGEFLPSKCEAPSSRPSATKKKKKAILFWLFMTLGRMTCFLLYHSS